MRTALPIVGLLLITVGLMPGCSVTLENDPGAGAGTATTRATAPDPTAAAAA